MLKRKVINDLINWKNNHKNTCLLVFGARQVGKTFIIEKFAEENYDNYYKLDFLENKSFRQIFDENLDSSTIIKKMSLMVENFTIEAHTLIFLDEIQVCPNAIVALKYLAQDDRFDVIASGSMLGVTYKEVSSFPVGYVERLEMHSLDFREFCWANGIGEDAIDYLMEYFNKRIQIPDVMHSRMMNLFKEYIVVGGMPQVVSDFVLNHNFARVLKIQRDIVESYRDDIIKYAKENEKPKIKECFNSIPVQLAQDYKKFRYSLVSKNGSSKKYGSSLEWLYDAGIVNFCYNLSSLEFPLEANKKDDVFKVYMRDTGLLISMLDDGIALEIINGNLGIYKGAIYENIIADIFTKLGKKLYYFEYNSTLEIDFFMRFENKVTAVEVKSADNTKSKSLNSVMTNWGVKQGIKLSSKNIGEGNLNVINLPLYMAMFL